MLHFETTTSIAAPPELVWATLLQTERSIELRGGMPLGLFTGTRTYRLDPDGDRAGRSGTIFHMTEAFTGPLAPLIGRSIPDLQPSFDAFAAGLRSAVEADQTNRADQTKQADQASRTEGD